jgi:SAM-dependent methyltransferase
MGKPYTAQRQAVWTRHWSTGAAHSCAGSYADTYGGAIAAFWASVHAHTAAGARVLDLATGNGAVPRLLLQLRPSLDLSIDAVDIAGNAPAWTPTQAAALRFHPHVSAEALPFSDQQFDLVVSQYGLEYTDLARALPELLRVRAADGRIALLMHHANSRPAALARVEMDHLSWLQRPDGLLATCAEMLAPMALAGTASGRAELAEDPLASQVRERFNAAQIAVSARARAIPDGADVLGEVQDAVAQLLKLAVRSGAAAARQSLWAFQRSLDDARWRLQELNDCALDAAAASSLRARLEAAGLRTSLQVVAEGCHLMGWTLQAS